MGDEEWQGTELGQYEAWARSRFTSKLKKKKKAGKEEVTWCFLPCRVSLSSLCVIGVTSSLSGEIWVALELRAACALSDCVAFLNFLEVLPTLQDGQWLGAKDAS